MTDSALPDLLTYRDRYPDAPGFKRCGTSEDAARSVRRRAEVLRVLVLDQVTKAGDYGITADECATALEEDDLSVRPRFSELSDDRNGRTPKIKDSHRTRMGKRGKAITVWVLA
jgi:hypothetical protein